MEPITTEQKAALEYRELPLTFTGVGEVRGVKFKQLKKTGKGYIYQRTDPSGSISFEVFKKVLNPRFAVISYPRSASFGVWAWSTKTVEAANEYLNRFETNEPAARSGKN